MNDAKKEKLRKYLLALDLIGPEDELEACVQANYLSKLIGKFWEWKRGWAYFTKERLVFPTGLLDENIVIPYKNIRQIGKCSQGLFPIGFTVTYEHLKTGELVTDKFSIMKRDKWIGFLGEKAGIN